MINTPETFFAKLKKLKSGCIVWTGNKNKKERYGHFGINGKLWLVHRYSYFINVGDCSGKCVCHTCDTPGCVNPKHLFLTTQKENMVDMAKKLRSGCLKLKPAEVKKIRKLCARGKKKREIAKMFSVNESTIRDIAFGYTWAWLT